MTKKILAVLAAAAFAPAALAAGQGPATPAPGGVTIEPSVQCAQGHRLEIIMLSQAVGDPIDGVWAFCRPPEQSRHSWISMLKTVRHKLSSNTHPKVARAIKRAFDNHIAKVKAEG